MYFDQINAVLVTIYFYKNILQTPNFWTIVYIKLNNWLLNNPT